MTRRIWKARQLIGAAARTMFSRMTGWSSTTVFTEKSERGQASFSAEAVEAFLDKARVPANKTAGKFYPRAIAARAVEHRADTAVTCLFINHYQFRATPAQSLSAGEGKSVCDGFRFSQRSYPPPTPGAGRDDLNAALQGEAVNAVSRLGLKTAKWDPRSAGTNRQDRDWKDLNI